MLHDLSGRLATCRSSSIVHWGFRGGTSRTSIDMAYHIVLHTQTDAGRGVWSFPLGHSSLHSVAGHSHSQTIPVSEFEIFTTLSSQRHSLDLDCIVSGK